MDFVAHPISARQNLGRIIFGILSAFTALSLINHLRLEWTLNEQYSYGWAVPFLCLFLAWKGFSHNKSLVLNCQLSISHAAFVVAGIGLIGFLGARWIGEANPEWRPVSWVMAVSTIAFILSMARLGWGTQVARLLAFPLFFFLVALPWPTPIEQPLVQALTRWIVGATTELLNAFGFVAISAGNIIETSGGVVDVDEACSGIRSLQASLMLALFFGQMHRLTARQRFALCGSSVAFAFIFNVARTFLLSLAAARHGAAGVDRWHDATGITVLLGCFAAVWAFSVSLSKRKASSAGAELKSPPMSTAARSARSGVFGCSPIYAVVLLGLLLFGELFIHFWYSVPSKNPATEWAVTLPTNSSTFQAIVLPKATVNILRFNEDASGKWLRPDGSRWQMYYFRWFPGRTAVHLARNHTPDICLPATGHKLLGTTDTLISAHGLNFPFRCYVTGDYNHRTFVFYSLWEDGASDQRVISRLLDRRTRMEAVLHRRRNPGQRVIEIALTGARDQAHAEELLRAELPKLINVLL